MAAGTSPSEHSTDKAQQQRTANASSFVLQLQDRVLTAAEIASLTRADRFATQRKRLEAIGLVPIETPEGPSVTFFAVALAMTRAQILPSAPAVLDVSQFITSQIRQAAAAQPA